MSSPDPPNILPWAPEFLTALGHMIITWNEAESALRRLLAGLCGRGSVPALLKAQIVTAELGSVGLSNALRTFADIILPSKPAEAINHAVEYYETVRAYRNYYTHGTDILPVSDGPRGFIRITTAKGSLTEEKDFVSLDDLKFVSGHAHCLHCYVQAISNHLFSEEWRFFSKEWRFPLPDKPLLPDKLRKNSPASSRAFCTSRRILRSDFKGKDLLRRIIFVRFLGH